MVIHSFFVSVRLASYLSLVSDILFCVASESGVDFLMALWYSFRVGERFIDRASVMRQ